MELTLLKNIHNSLIKAQGEVMNCLVVLAHPLENSLCNCSKYVSIEL